MASGAEMAVSVVLRARDQLTGSVGRARKTMGELNETVTRVGRNTGVRMLKSSVEGVRKSVNGVGDSLRQVASADPWRRQIDGAKAYGKTLSRLDGGIKRIGSAQERIVAERDRARGQLLDAAALAAPVAAAVHQAISFESAMADLNKVANYTPKRFAEVRKEVLAMSRQMPVAADQITAIMTAAAQSGVAAEQVQGFARTALKMGVAFDISGSESGQMLANWRAGMRLTQDQANELADVTNYLSNNMNATAPAIGRVVQRMGPIAKAAGLGANQIAGLSAALLSSGANEEVVGTALKNLTQRLTSGASATKSQRAAFQMLGLDVEKMAAAMQDDAAGAIDTVFKRLASLDRVDRPSVISDLFGQEAVGAIAPLLSNLGLLEQGFALAGDKARYAGSMQREYDTRSKTTANNVQLLQNQLSAMSIQIGSVLLPTFNALIGGINPVIEGVSDLADRFPLATKVIVGATTALIGIKVASIAGGYAFTFIKGGALSLAKGLLYLRKALTFAAVGVRVLSAAVISNPIVAAIAAIAGAAYLIYRYWGPISDFVLSLWARITGIVSSAYDALTGWLGWDPLAVIAPVWDGLKAYWSGIWGALKQVVSGDLSAIGDLLAALNPLNIIRPAFAAAWAWLSNLDWSEAGKKLVTTLVNGITGAAGAVADAVKGALAKAREYLPFSDAKRGPLSDLTKSGSRLPSTFAAGIVDNQGALVGAVDRVMQAANDTLAVPMRRPEISAPRGPAGAMASEGNAARAVTPRRIETPPAMAAAPAARSVERHTERVVPFPVPAARPQVVRATDRQHTTERHVLERRERDTRQHTIERSRETSPLDLSPLLASIDRLAATAQHPAPAAVVRPQMPAAPDPIIIRQADREQIRDRQHITDRERTVERQRETTRHETVERHTAERHTERRDSQRTIERAVPTSPLDLSPLLTAVQRLAAATPRQAPAADAPRSIERIRERAVSIAAPQPPRADNPIILRPTERERVIDRRHEVERQHTTERHTREAVRTVERAPEAVTPRPAEQPTAAAALRGHDRAGRGQRGGIHIARIDNRPNVTIETRDGASAAEIYDQFDRRMGDQARGIFRGVQDVPAEEDV